MDKAELLQAIVIELEAVHQNAIDATARAQDTATNKNNVAENKYDTLGLEAAYLAHGQAQRVIECQKDLLAFKTLKAVIFTEETPIALGALLRLEDEAGSESNLFLGPAAGGLKVRFNQKTILIITPSAPLGKALMANFVGDDIALKLGDETQSYTIMAIA